MIKEIKFFSCDRLITAFSCNRLIIFSTWKKVEKIEKKATKREKKRALPAELRDGRCGILQVVRLERLSVPKHLQHSVRRLACSGVLGLCLVTLSTFDSYFLFVLNVNLVLSLSYFPLSLSLCLYLPLSPSFSLCFSTSLSLSLSFSLYLIFSSLSLCLKNCSNCIPSALVTIFPQVCLI